MFVSKVCLPTVPVFVDLQLRRAQGGDQRLLMSRCQAIQDRAPALLASARRVCAARLRPS